MSNAGFPGPRVPPGPTAPAAPPKKTNWPVLIGLMVVLGAYVAYQVADSFGWMPGPGQHSRSLPWVATPTPTHTGTTGLRFATDDDIATLKTQLATVPHVTGVYVNYEGLTQRRSTSIYVDTDLPEVGIDGADTKASPPFRQLRDDLGRMISRLPFDLGSITVSAGSSGVHSFYIASFEASGLATPWGPTPAPTHT
ncbi:MAG: hypothetical protein WAV45_10605 [Propionibacteriaceae bacterium]|nr:hypothetical protein [Micropruina sp.]